MVNITKIKNLAKKKGIKLRFLVEKIDVSSTYLFDVEHGRYKMSQDKLAQIAAVLGTTVEYLTDQTDDPALPHKRGVKIKVFGDVAAGIPIEQIDNFDPDDADSWEEIGVRTASEGEYFALRIKGDSMEPRMFDGDIVIVRHQNEVESGDIAVVAINGDTATCKRIKKDESGIVLVSLNSKYDPMFYSNEQIADLPITILGKVVEVRGRL